MPHLAKIAAGDFGCGVKLPANNSYFRFDRQPGVICQSDRAYLKPPLDLGPDATVSANTAKAKHPAGGKDAHQVDDVVSHPYGQKRKCLVTKIGLT